MGRGGGGGWNKGLFMVVMAVAAVATVGQAQIDAGCAQQLSPCLEFLDSANPPVSCCSPIEDMVVNDLSCLCFVYTNTDFLQSYGLNRTIAVGLVRRCGVTVSFASCSHASAPSPTQATLPQATPGADVGGATAGRAVSCTVSLVLLFCAFLLLP